MTEQRLEFDRFKVMSKTADEHRNCYDYRSNDSENIIRPRKEIRRHRSTMDLAYSGDPQLTISFTGTVIK